MKKFHITVKIGHGAPLSWGEGKGGKKKKLPLPPEAARAAAKNGRNQEKPICIFRRICYTMKIHEYIASAGGVRKRFDMEFYLRGVKTPYG